LTQQNKYRLQSVILKTQLDVGGDGAVDKTHLVWETRVWIHCETPMCPWARHL